MLRGISDMEENLELAYYSSRGANEEDKTGSVRDGNC
jgi:hypothetical protein